MSQREDLRPLDPVDPTAPDVGNEALLRRILAAPAPAPAHRRTHVRRRVPRLRLGLLAAVGAAAVALVFSVPRGSGGDVLAAAFEAVHQPGTILHYTSVQRPPGQPGGAASVPEQPAGDEMKVEVWQAADGSRQRVLTRSPGLGLGEEVVDGHRSQTYIRRSNEIIVYDERAPKPDAPGGVGAPTMGDPRTLLERARDPKETVVDLGKDRVRGIDVRRFRVGRCIAHVHRSASGGGVAMEYESPLIVSIAEADSMPVRVQWPACRAESGGGSSPVAVPEGPTIDYEGLEVLDDTAVNERQLEMAPHPGAAVRDGEDIDAAEERAERGQDDVTVVPEPADQPPSGR